MASCYRQIGLVSPFHIFLGMRFLLRVLNAIFLFLLNLTKVTFILILIVCSLLISFVLPIVLQLLLLVARSRAHLQFDCIVNICCTSFFRYLFHLSFVFKSLPYPLQILYPHFMSGFQTIHSLVYPILLILLNSG
jgi:hypothetical protein